MLCCITMYNEDKEALNGTLEGIRNNLQEFNKIGIKKD